MSGSLPSYTAVSSVIKLPLITSVSSVQLMSLRHTELALDVLFWKCGHWRDQLGPALCSLQKQAEMRIQALSTLRHQSGHSEPLSWHFCYVCSLLTAPCVILTIRHCTSLSNQTPALPSWGSVWEDLDQSKYVSVSFPCQNFAAGRVCAQGWETVQSQ